MRVNITLACTDCGERNYISKRTSVTIQSVLNLKNIALARRSTLFTVKQSNNRSFSQNHSLVLAFYLLPS